MLLTIQSKVLTSVEIYLKFDDLSEKTVILNIGDIKKITYNNKGELVTIEGEITNMIIPQAGGEIYIMMDCSEQYDAKEIKFSANNIRDIYVSPTNQKGLTYAFSDYMPEKHYIKSEIRYNSVSDIDLVIDINSKTIDPEVLNYILEQVPGKYGNGIVYAELTTSLGKGKYIKANKFANNSTWVKEDSIGQGTELQDIKNGLFVLHPFAVMVYYRLSENDPWINGNLLPETTDLIKDLGDQLSYVLTIEKDKLYREYGTLFRLEPIKTGKVSKNRIDLFKDTELLGTEYIYINYNNKRKPTEIILGNEEIELKIDETKTLTGRVLPDNTPIPFLLFESKDPTIATVDSKSGLITGMSIGQTVIIVSAADDSSIFKKFYVNVRGNDKPNIIMNASNQSIKVDENKNVPITFSELSNGVTQSLEIDSLRIIPNPSESNIIATLTNNTLNLTGKKTGTSTLSLEAEKAGYNKCRKNITITITEADPGTPSNPFPIESTEDLEKIFDNPEASYDIKAEEINMAGSTWIPNEFNGTIKGNGCIIKNISIVENPTVFNAIEETLAEGVQLDDTKSVYDLSFDGPTLIIPSEEIDANIILKNVTVGEAGYDHVRLFITVKTPEDGKIIVKATDENGKDFDIVDLGTWGPPSGFPIPAEYTFSTPVKASCTAAGEYSITIIVKDLDTDTNIIENTYSLNVSNLNDNITGGMFTKLENATISGLKIENVKVNVNNTTHVGALTGLLSGKCNIENVNVSGNIKGSGYTGALIGVVDTDSDLKITNCVNSSSISVEENVIPNTVGGIIGIVNDAVVDMQHCSNTGTLSSTNSGGCIGRVYSNSIVVLTSCNDSTECDLVGIKDKDSSVTINNRL